MKLIANYILNIFQNSNKKHLLITGSKHIGKTTLLHSILENKTYPGITSKLEEGKCVYLYENNTDHKTIIGLFKNDANNYGQPMETIKEGFIDLGIPALKRALDANSEWVTIDEIGFLESQELEFQKSILDIMNKKRLIAVVRLQETPFIHDMKTRDDVFVVNLDEISHRFGCIIMASGQSKRYGSNKLLERIEDKTLIEHVIALLDDALFDCKLVLTRTSEVKDICDDLNIPCILHDLEYRNEAIALGIEKMSGMDQCMFIPCDQPLLTKESIKNILLKSITNKGKMIRLATYSQEGSPVLFDACFFDELKCLPEKKGGSYLMKKYPEHKLCVYTDNDMELKDIDTKSDYDYIVEYLQLKGQK